MHLHDLKTLKLLSGTATKWSRATYKLSHYPLLAMCFTNILKLTPKQCSQVQRLEWTTVLSHPTICTPTKLSDADATKVQTVGSLRRKPCIAIGCQRYGLHLRHDHYRSAMCWGATWCCAFRLHPFTLLPLKARGYPGLLQKGWLPLVAVRIIDNMAATQQVALS